MTSLNENPFRVTGVTRGFPSQRASCAELWWFFDVRVNKRLNKLWNHRWFEALWWPCDVTIMLASLGWRKWKPIKNRHIAVYNDVAGTSPVKSFKFTTNILLGGISDLSSFVYHSNNCNFFLLGPGRQRVPVLWAVLCWWILRFAALARFFFKFAVWHFTVVIISCHVSYN